MAKFDPALLPARPDLNFERRLWEAGLVRVAGIDEAGRGALAGPVAAAAVILPPDPDLYRNLDGIRDSKAMTVAQRAHWARRLPTMALAAAVGFASPQEIDTWGVLPATRMAACRALEGLEGNPDHLLLDHLFLPDVPIPQTSLTKGDARALSIAAASVLAKSARDLVMIALDRTCPGYGFAAHKGYGTQEHRDLLTLNGPTCAHRRSFAPLRMTSLVESGE